MANKQETTEKESLLDPENNRLEFFNHLMPDHDYEVDFAIGTTYSLDLKTALCVPLSMEMRADTDSKKQKSDICQIVALQKTADKIALFCNNGQISADKIPSGGLHILLEKMIFPVTITNASFHSKFWLIRFKNKNDIRFRLIVLSRNLTEDKSWDVIYCKDADKEKADNEVIENLKGYISYLANQLPEKEKTKKMEDIIKELDDYSFDGLEEFLAFYQENRPIPDFLTPVNKKGIDPKGNILVISPFISKETIKNILKHFNDVTLITREDELGEIKKLNKDNLNVFIPNGGIGIHAKVYVTGNDIYLGSFNASKNAREYNVETLIHINRKDAYTIIKEELLGSDKNLFEEVADFSEVEDNKKDESEKILNEFMSLHPTAELKENSLTIKIEQTNGTFPPKTSFYIEPLDAGIEQLEWKDTKSVTFTNVSEKSKIALSNFYKVTIDNNEKEANCNNKEKNKAFSKVVIIPTSALPDGREAAILDAVVNNANVKDYILYWLDSGYLPSFEEREPETDGKKENRARSGKAFSGLYEIMLEAACRKDAKEIFAGLKKNLEQLLSNKESDDNSKNLIALIDTFNNALENEK